MPDEHPNVRLIRDFHEGQNRFYARGEQGPVSAMLTADVAWHVPGRSAIAGDYRGRDEVLGHFARRRELARATFRIDVRGVVADDERAVILAGGEVERDGQPFTWGTAVIFRIEQGRIAECWVLPYDQQAFDEIWSPAAAGLDSDVVD
jgi:ketosteroid isomerase-like protein